MPQARKPRAPKPESTRAQRRREAKEAPDQIDGKTEFQLTVTGEELAFARLLLTQATVGPAALKKIAGSFQEKIEAIIGPMPQ